MKKKQPKSLKDLIDKIDWMMIEPGRGSTRLPDDSVTIGFCQSKKNDPTINEVRVRFGKEVLEKLNWKSGDKVCVFNDPDDLLTFMLVKSDSGVGYTVAQETGSPSSRVHFRWRHKLPLTKKPPTSVEYEIHKKHIVFRAGSKANFEE